VQILTVHADFFTYRVFNLPRSSFLAKQTRTFIVFALSGLNHVAGDYMAFNDTRFGALKAFLLQACAMFVEDAVQELVQRSRGRPLGRPGLIGRVLGYVYVLVFATWSWGYWVYLFRDTTYADEVGNFGIVARIVHYFN